MNDFDVLDLLRVKIPADVALSPDGRECVYALRTLDEDKGEFRTKLWRAMLPDGSPTQLTYGTYRDVSPCYSATGAHIGFLSDRGGDADEDDEEAAGKLQLYILSLSGGEARPIAPSLGQVYDFAFRADGKAVYVVVDAEKSAYDKQLDKLRAEQKRDFTHEERAIWPKRICEIELDSDTVTTIYDRDYGLLELTASHGGNHVVFSTNRTGLNNDWDNINLWILERPLTDAPSEGRWNVRPLVVRQGTCQGARFSPDDRLITYIAPRLEHAEHSQSEVWLTRIDGADQPLNLTAALGVVADAQMVEWTAAGELLIQQEQGLFAPLVRITGLDAAGLRDAGSTSDWDRLKLDRVSVQNVSAANHIVRDFAVSQDGGTAVTIAEDANTPFELFWHRTATGESKPITNLQAEWQEKQRAQVEAFKWRSFDGLELEGVLALPANHRGVGKVPLLVVIHGGPAWHTTLGFHQYLNWHWLASLGYAVFAPNYRGGIAYGQDYLYANQRDLGGRDYRDILSGVDAVVATGLVDEQRMGVTGGSYGGYMTNWIIGHDHRFQAAVSEFGIWSLFTDFGCSSGRGWETMYLGRYWENEALYLERSPSRYVADVATPVLIVHGDADDNTFIANSKEMYNALLEAGKTVEFIHYPREGHGVREPRHRQDELARIAAWFAHYIPTDRTLPPAQAGEWRELPERNLKMRVSGALRTSAHAGLGDGFRDLVAVRVDWVPRVEAQAVPEHAAATSADKAQHRTPELSIGSPDANHVFLTWSGVEPEQRASVVADHEAAPVGVQVSGMGTLTGEFTLKITEEGGAVLLFSAELARLAQGRDLCIKVGTTRFSVIVAGEE